LFLTSFFFSCDEAEDFFNGEVDITTSFSHTSQISVLEIDDPNTWQNFSVSGGFNILTNAEISDALGTSGEIKKVEITDIQYEYKNFSGNVDAVTLGSSFSIASGFMNTQNFTIPTINIAQSDLLEERFTLTGDFTEINSFIAETNVFTYGFEGLISHNPALFDVEVTVTLKITIEIDP